MPVVVAVLCAVVALVLLMVLLQSRGALASTQDALGQADRRAAKSAGETAAGRTRIEELGAEIGGLDSELEAARDLAAERAASIETIQKQFDTERSRTEVLQTDLEAAVDARNGFEAEVADRDGAVATANEMIAEQQQVAQAREEVNLALTHQTEELQVQLIEAADDAAKRSIPSVPSVLVSDDGSELKVPGFSPGMAWDLELVRSQRTWRYSVAANPVEDLNPFDTADNPLRLAIEVEALALREDVGAFIGIDWQAGTDIDPEADPARAHLTLRLAQELLASAARELSPSTLIVTSDAARGGVSLEVVASDPNDVDFKIPAPPVASEWIGIDEHGGMVVTVRAAD